MEALCQLSYSPERDSERYRARPRPDNRSAPPVYVRDVTVQALDLVELAHLGEEHVHDDIAIVDEHPLMFVDTLDPPWRPARRLTRLPLDIVDERTHQPPVRCAHLSLIHI